MNKHGAAISRAKHGRSSLSIGLLVLLARCLGAVAGLGLFVVSPRADAAVFQWSAVVDDVTSNETKDHPRAFLWIPENCQRVRAVVIADQNMEEEQLFQDPEFRKALSDLGFAEVWVVPAMGRSGERIEKLLNALGEQSGYEELEFAPLVPTGHSATDGYGYALAAWNPERVLAVLSLSGAWPIRGQAVGKNFDMVPCLTTKGEYEIQGSLEKGWYAGLKGDYLQAHPYAAFSHVVEPGDGHFSTSKEKIALINLFLRKAAHYRLPAEMPASGPVTLKPIDAKATGCCYEVWHVNDPPSVPAAPVAEFQGKKDHYWAFDEEMAKAIEQFQGRFKNQTAVLLAYKQANGFTAPTPDHSMVHLKFEPIEDGMTFKLSGGFWDNVPATKDGKRAEWQGWLGEGVRDIKQNDPLPHPQGEENLLSIIPYCGPVAQLAPETFAIRFNRIGTMNPKRSNDPYFMLTYAGDGTYKKMVQQAELRFPLNNTRGIPQTIGFPKIPDQKAGSTMASIKLKATSSANVPVYYYVREGPAEVDDSGTLTFAHIPPRAKYPVQVTVVAWQWGRSTEPMMQSAIPVEQTFSIDAMTAR